MSKYKAIVVGAGGISNEWFMRLKEEQVPILAVVDLNKSAAEEKIVKYELDTEATTDLAGALKRHQADFLIDLTVPEAHCAVTCAGLTAGLHVVSEKPMASSMAEARTMVRTAE